MIAVFKRLSVLIFAMTIELGRPQVLAVMKSSYESILRDGFCFPSDFLFGTATAAYQVEGGWNATGRSPSIWDEFCRERDDVECANVADDFLHRYPEDLQRVSDMNMQTFRFSISWSRVMSWDENSKSMVRNDEGLAFYHALIDDMKGKGLIPVATMYHWDLPLELHTKLEPAGWLNSDIVSHFATYSELLFEEFGAVVPYWATFNEPWTFTLMGYGVGVHAPGLSDSATNTYTAGHNVLRSHAKSVEIFRAKQVEGSVRAGAQISIVLNADYGFPLDPKNPNDVAAVERKMQFILGWFLSPIVNGDYPPLMKQYAGDNLPSFTPEESASLTGSYDLFMLNHYSSQLITDCDSPKSLTPCDELPIGWFKDLGVDSSRFPEGALTGGKDKEGHDNCAWFSVYPPGYMEVIEWMHAYDTDEEILLTENGYCGNEEIDSQAQTLYFHDYLVIVAAAVAKGIPIIGYTAWSLLDNYEWGSFNPRFGLFYVDYPEGLGTNEGYVPTPDELERVPRPVVEFFTQLASTKCLIQPKSSVNSVMIPMICFGVLTVVVIIRKMRKPAGGYEKL